VTRAEEAATLPIGAEVAHLDDGLELRRAAEVRAKSDIDADFGTPRTPRVLRVVGLLFPTIGLRIGEHVVLLLELRECLLRPVEHEHGLAAPRRNRTEQLARLHLGDVDLHRRAHRAGLGTRHPGRDEGNRRTDHPDRTDDGRRTDQEVTPLFVFRGIRAHFARTPRTLNDHSANSRSPLSL